MGAASDQKLVPLGWSSSQHSAASSGLKVATRSKDFVVKLPGMLSQPMQDKAWQSEHCLPLKDWARLASSALSVIKVIWRVYSFSDMLRKSSSIELA